MTGFTWWHLIPCLRARSTRWRPRALDLAVRRSVHQRSLGLKIQRVRMYECVGQTLKISAGFDEICRKPVDSARIEFIIRRILDLKFEIFKKSGKY
jgi:hypothetical protein